MSAARRARSLPMIASASSRKPTSACSSAADRPLAARRASCPARAGVLEAGVGLVAERCEARRQRVAPLLGLGELLAGLGADVQQRAAHVELGRTRAVERSWPTGLVDLRSAEGEVGRVERAVVALGIDPIVVGAQAAQERARLADGQFVLLLALLRPDHGVQQGLHAARIALRHRLRRLGGPPTARAVRHPLSREPHVVRRRDVRHRLLGLLRRLALQQLAHGPVADRAVRNAACRAIPAAGGRRFRCGSSPRHARPVAARIPRRERTRVAGVRASHGSRGLPHGRSRPAADVASRNRAASWRERQRGQPPLPRPRRPPRLVHARLAPQPEHVLRLHHRHLRARRERERDQVPPGLVARRAAARRRPARARSRRQRLVPAAQRVVVVRARVGDPVLARGWRRRARCPARRARSRTGARPCPGSPSESRSRRTAGVITPRSSAISGSAPSAARRGVEQRRAPGPRRQRPASAWRAPSGTAQ